MPDTPFHEEAGSLTKARGGPTFGVGSEGQDRAALRQEFAPDAFDWATLISQRVAVSMGNWGELNGVDLGFIRLKYSQFAPLMFDAIYSQFFVTADARRDNAPSQVQADISLGGNPEDYGVMGMGSAFYTTRMEGLDEMSAWALQWMSAKAGMQLVRDPGGSGRRGSGSRGPTAQEIRNQFDLDELAGAVNDMNRGLVLEDHADAKGLARKYVDAIVATRAEKEIDFETFVRGKIEATARFKNIYKRKPASVSAEAYIAPYLQAAMQMASPNEAAEIAIGGAQFGTSAESFRQRLNRTDDVTGSAPFINALEGRMNSLTSVLKG